MTLVFAETNFLLSAFRVDFKRVAAAVAILDQYRSGCIQLAVPLTSFIEVRHTIRQADEAVVHKLEDAGEFRQQATKSYRDIDTFFGDLRSAVQTNLGQFEAELGRLQTELGKFAIPFDDKVAAKVMEVRSVPHWRELHPFDEAILAAVATAAERHGSDFTSVYYVSTDGHMSNQNKEKTVIPDREAFYARHHITYVRGFDDLLALLSGR